METQHTDLETLTPSPKRWFGACRWWKTAGILFGLSATAVVLIAAQGPPDTTSTTSSMMPGWIVVQKRGASDDTAVIQRAIDSLADTGGVVWLAAGSYQHKGLTGRANVHLRGVQASSVRLDFTPDTGDGITLGADPDNFAMSDLTLTSSGRSDGWAVRAEKGTHRSLRFEGVNVGGFHNGILITNAIDVTIRQCRIGHTYADDPKGIGIQFGNGRDMGGNGVTVEDCYLNSLKTGIVTYAQACLISRPVIELCHTGIETHGITSIVMPWYDKTTDVAHVSIQPNTIGGRSGTGALLLGYGSAGWKVQYGTDAERQRSLILPERVDFGPGSDPGDPQGIKLGTVVIDRDGVVHAKDFHKIP